VGIILTLSGASASGKTTVAKEIISTLRGARMILSVTTRDKRPNDLRGEYAYITKEYFAELKAGDAFLWDVSYAENYYGTQRRAVLDAAERPHGVGIMILLPSAVENLSKFLLTLKGVKHVPVFILPPDIDELRRRLRSRGDTEASIASRLESDGGEVMQTTASSIKYHFVSNKGDIKDTVHKVLELL
jgi:guanylate kinase